MMGSSSISAPQRHHLSCFLLDGLLASHGHRGRASGDSMQMIPPPTFTENGTDPMSVTSIACETRPHLEVRTLCQEYAIMLANRAGTVSVLVKNVAGVAFWRAMG